MKLLRRGIAGGALILAFIFLIGCKSGGDASKGNNTPYTFDPTAGDANMTASSGLPGSQSGPAYSAPAPKDTEGYTAILKPGDTITVALNDITPAVQPMQDQIKEDGSITLFWNQKFMAAGKTVRQLQDEIHDRYVPQYYTHATASITTLERFFSVGGEVKAPNRYVWTPGITVLRAISMSGGFTDYSRKGDVIITRANTRKQEHENCKDAIKKPELDLPIYPGDAVFVKKRIW